MIVGSEYWARGAEEGLRPEWCASLEGTRRSCAGSGGTAHTLADAS